MLGWWINCFLKMFTFRWARSNISSMSANQLISLSFLAGLFQCVTLFGPYIGIGDYPLLASLFTSTGYWYAVRAKGIRVGSQPYRDFADIVHWCFTIFATALVPLLVFLHYASPLWMKVVGIPATLFCIFGWLRVEKLVRPKNKDSKARP